MRVPAQYWNTRKYVVGGGKRTHTLHVIILCIFFGVFCYFFCLLRFGKRMPGYHDVYTYVCIYNVQPYPPAAQQRAGRISVYVIIYFC